MGRRQNMVSPDHALGVQIGRVCCALKCEDDEVYNALKKLYRNFITEQAADITVELKITDQPRPDNVSETLSETKNIREGNDSGTAGHRSSCKYDLARHFISITGDRSLVDPATDYNHLNQLLSLAYYSACKMKYSDYLPALLVHACGILRHGRVMIFAGPSGAGKTTVARLCGERNGEVINDEMLLISRPATAGGSINVQNAPVISRFSSRHHKSAPLGCIVLLKKGNRTLARCLDRVDAYLRFMRQIITPVYIGETEIKAILAEVAEFSDQVTRTIPVYELEFTLDGESLWQSAGEIERELTGRGLQYDSSSRVPYR